MRSTGQRDLGPLACAAFESSLGWVAAAIGPRGLRALLVADTREAVCSELTTRCGLPSRVDCGGGDSSCHDASGVSLSADFQARVGAMHASLQAFFADLSQPPPTLDLDLSGTPFQLSVWSALRSIPRGQVLSYQQLATRLGRPSASRAVATACAANPCAVLLPCHRVVGSDGSLRGYRWGLQRKQVLLSLEGASLSGFA